MYLPQLSVGVIKRNDAFDGASCVENANLTRAKANAARRVPDRVFFTEEHGLHTRALVNCQPFRNGMISMIVTAKAFAIRSTRIFVRLRLRQELFPRVPLRGRDRRHGRDIAVP